MQKIMILVLFIAVPFVAGALDIARPHSVPAPAQTKYSPIDLAHVVQLIVAKKITKDNRKKLVEGNIEQPLAGLVIMRVALTHEGRLKSVALDRSAFFDKSKNGDAEKMIRDSAPYDISGTHYDGGEFQITFLFDHHGRFKMRALD